MKPLDTTDINLSGPVVNFGDWTYNVLTSLGVPHSFAEKFDEIITIAAIIGIAIALKYLLQVVIEQFIKKLTDKYPNQWSVLIIKHKVIHYIFDMLPAFFVLLALPYTLVKYKHLKVLTIDVCEVYLTFISAMIINGILLCVSDAYYSRNNNPQHPIKGLIQVLQVVDFSLCAIIMVSIMIEKSPAKLIARLGASAAILMLVFKDSIVGFVAGVQLSMNNMLRPGDWITVPSANINGTVLDITINTVKVQNFDNTYSTIPPYTLINSSFQNWRGMQESAGRRVNKTLFLNMLTIQFVTQETVDKLKQALPLMADYQFDQSDPPTNSQLFREYIERYLRSLPVVNTDLDLIVSQQQMTCTGVPIQIYFFSRNKVWAQYEKIQSDIFDHLIAVVPTFGLQIFQYPPETIMS